MGALFMDSKADNIVLYDWLSFTSKIHTPEQIIDALGLSHVPWTNTKGAKGYQDRKYFSCISTGIVPSNIASTYPLIEVSGERKSCETLEINFL